MIISNEEIRHVLDLHGSEAARSAVGVRPTQSAAPAQPGGHPLTLEEGLPLGVRRPDPNRLVRLKSLQELLLSEGYEVPVDLLAAKMIGRALCDQVSRLYEASS